MYHLSYSTQFKKDIKRCQKRKYDFTLFKKVIELLEGRVNYLQYINHIF